MRALNLHLKVLIALLVSLGILVTAYQIFILGIPMTTDETDYLWNVDAKVEFQASSRDPVKVQMFVPPLNRDYVSLNESFISNNYGVSVNRVDGNRKVTWSARRASGNQTLYYRLVLTKRYSDEKPKAKGPIFRDSIAVEGAEKIAAEALLAPIRQHSADVETFIGEAIKRVNNLNDDNVKLLLAGADCVMIASSLLKKGPAQIGVLVRGVEAWLAERGYDSVEQMKGSLSQQACPDPDAFERANYMKALKSYTSEFA